MWRIAEALTPFDRCAEYTQAIMDLGATVCLPRIPACDLCPLSSGCGACRSGTQNEYPIRKATPQIPHKQVTMVMVVDRRGKVLLERRPASGVWGGLWSFPEYNDSLDKLAQWFRRAYSVEIRIGRPLPAIAHRFTHLRLDITPLPCEALQKLDNHSTLQNLSFLSIPDALRAGIPAPVKSLLQELQTRKSP